MKTENSFSFGTRLLIIMLPLIIIILAFICYAIYDYFYVTRPFYESLRKVEKNEKINYSKTIVQEP
jgi:glucan phosphoethanolaminetransferase (alkaline phosphatase superfamily)